MYSNYILERSRLDFSNLVNFLPGCNVFDNDFHQSSQLERLLIQAQGFAGLGHKSSPLPNRYVFGNDFHQPSQPEVRAQNFGGLGLQPATLSNRHAFGNDFHQPSHPEQRLVVAQDFRVLGYQTAASTQGFKYTGPPFGLYGQGFGHRVPFESYGQEFHHTAPFVSYGQGFNCTGNLPFESFGQGLGHNKVPCDEFNPNDTRVPLGLPIVPYNVGLDPLEHLRIEGLPRLAQWIKQVITDAKHKIGRYKANKLATPHLVKGGVISVAPVSFRRPDQDTTPEEKSRKRKKVRALLIAKNHLSFGMIPKELEQFLPLIDEFLVRHTGIQPQVSFAQRRCDWCILIKQRSDGKFDSYYYHMSRNLRCRSVMEVIKFMLGHIIPKKAQSAVRRKRSRGENAVFQPSNDDDSDISSDSDDENYWDQNLDKGKGVLVEEVPELRHAPMGLLEYRSEGNSSREAHWAQNNVGSYSGAQQTLDLLQGSPNQTTTAEAHWSQNKLGFDWRAHQTLDLLQDPSNPTPPVAFAPPPPFSPGHHGLMNFGQWIDDDIFYHDSA